KLLTEIARSAFDFGISGCINASADANPVVIIARFSPARLRGAFSCFRVLPSKLRHYPVPTPLDRCLQPVTGLAAKAQTRIRYVPASRGCSATPPRHLRSRNHAGHSVAMIRPAYLDALGDLGYSQQESRFVYLAATHSRYFTLR